MSQSTVIGDVGAYNGFTDQGEAVASEQRTPFWIYYLAVWGLICGATWLAHGWSITTGLTLDDHFHDQYLARPNWTTGDLFHATTIDTDDFVHLWWQDKPVRFQYFRPVAVLLMKTVYDLSGGSALAQHVASLGLHVIAAVLVHALALCLTRHRLWSLVAALLFVVYSHSVFAVGWLAAQNIILQTVFMLAALLLYIRASGLHVGPQSTDATIVAPSGHLRAGSMAGCAVCWIFALLSRESAIMLPAILVAFDVAFGGWRHARSRLSAYVLFAVVGLAFVALRMTVFYFPMPDVYVHRPDGVGYIPWALAKLMHYVASAIWLSPMIIGPTGRLSPFTESPGDCLLMFAIIAVLSFGYYRVCRHIRGWWIWPLWLVLAILPMIPVMATPHSGYVYGVAFAIGMTLGPGAGRFLVAPRTLRISRGVATWFLVATCTYIPIYRTLWNSMIATDHLILEDLHALPAPEDATDLFFINLPFTNVYIKNCLDEVWRDNTPNATCHVLTFAPSVLGMNQPFNLEQIDERSFELSVPDTPYFSGFLGRFLLDGMRCDGPLQEGQRSTTVLFDACVTGVSPAGVTRIRFEFHEPLASERFRFYVASQRCGLTPLCFRTTPQSAESRIALAKDDASRHDDRQNVDWVLNGDADSVFAAMRIRDDETRVQAWEAIRETGLPIAEALGDPVRTEFTASPPDDESLSRIERWWRTCVDEQLVEHVLQRRGVRDRLEKQRDRLFWIRRVAARIIRTDLYFTGPPYPGPRFQTKESELAAAVHASDARPSTP